MLIQIRKRNQCEIVLTLEFIVIEAGDKVLGVTVHM